MPVKTGLEMLRWIKGHPKYKVVPTIVVSSSADLGDIRDVYEAGAESYMLKQADPENLVQKLSLIFQYWAECELPTKFLE
jgi:DNA-binding NarL/FixJ family response regulator